MFNFNHLNIGKQLALAFGAVLALTLFLAYFALMRIATIDAAFESQNQLVSDRLEPLYAAREALAQTGLAARNAYIFTDEVAARRELDLLDAEKARYLAAIERLSGVMGNDAAFEKVRGGMLTMARELERPRRYREAGQLAEFGRFLVEECSPLRRQIVADIAAVLIAEQNNAAKARATAQLVANNAYVWIVVQSIASLLVGAVIAYLITGMLLRQLGGEPKYAVEISNRIAQGDLALTVQTQHGSDASLLAAIAAMRDSLAGIVGEVRGGTLAIEHASDEIAHGNHDLSERTAHQAQELERIAQAMDELTDTVKQNAANARQASALSRSASDVSEKGGQVVQQVVQTMVSIEASSRRIVDIISVIDSIAFQTNILALNAAVEAARAGEQGRGFAVVASEVRNLAQRSALAAQEIKALITDTVQQVDSGAQLVQQAGDTMQDVVSSVGRVSAIMLEMSVASAAQSEGIQRVGVALGEMDTMTQQNAALVEEAAAAAQAMRQHAATLGRLVGIFKLAPESRVSRLTRFSGLVLENRVAG